WLRACKTRVPSTCRSQPPRKPARRTCRLALELLEERLVPAIFTVTGFLDNTTADSLLSLREAILLVNNGGTATAALGRSLTAGEQAQVNTSQPFGTNDTIQFAAGPAQTITLNGSELLLSTNMTVAGPGSALLAINGNAASRVFEVASGA